jgi:hypothetical protein
LVGWRDLSPDQLAARIRQIQRVAVEQHLSASAWRVVDQMRAKLRSHQRIDRRIQEVAAVAQRRRRRPRAPISRAAE